MGISLSPEKFAQAFPFHIAFNRELVVVQAGSVLCRICPEVRLGRNMADLFRLERPPVEFSFEAVRENHFLLFVLERIEGPLRFRGEMVPQEDGETMVFLGSPWITEPGTLRQHGLTLKDFPLHDPIGDFLQVMQSQVTAVAELRQLAAKLNQQRSALREALGVLNATLEATADGILVSDQEGRIISMNRRFADMWGLQEEPEAIRTTEKLRKLVLCQLADPAGFVERIEWLYRNPEEEAYDVIRCLDGRIIERNSRPHRIGDKITGRVWSHHDATENWQANEALRISEERYRIVAETASDGILTVDRDGQILFANRAAVAIFGYEREELLQMRLIDLMPEAMRPVHLASVKRYVETGHRNMNWRSVQVEGLRKGGTYVPLELSFGESLVEGRRWFTGIIRDVTERRKISRALEESERRYRSVVDHLKEIVFQTDSEGRWVFLNPAWGEVTGFPVPDTIGRRWDDGILATDKPQIEVLFGALRSGLQEFGWQTFRYGTRSGHILNLEVYARPMVDGDGGFAGISGTLTDVTERLDFAARLEKARDEAEAASRAKTHFLANMSHEIRTPLNAILGMSELMALTDLTEEQREYQETVATSTESLLHLINDLLDLSKIEAGQVDFDRAEFDPGDVCEEAVNLVKTRVLQKGLALNCRAVPAMPPRVVGDRNRVRQILVNLLGNALKFTATGGISLVLEWRILVGEQVELGFSVEDTGIGIREADLHRVFEKFVQLDTSFSSRFSGAGLGLNISRSLAEAMGGRMSLESEFGKGSRFSLHLKLPRAGRRAVEDFQLLDRCRDLKALLVAQHPDVRQALAAWGVSTLECTTAEEAGEILASSQAGGGAGIGLVVCGLVVGAAQRGVAVLRIGSGRTPAEPGKTKDPDVLDPPLVPSKLRKFLAGVLGVWLPSESKGLHPAPAATAARAAVPRILLVEDNRENRKLGNRILESSGCKVDNASNGREAVEMASGFIYDLILMDLRMPEMDGFQAATAIRKAEETRGGRVPIVALTAHALEDHRDRALQTGMDDYLTKPYRREQLLSMVDRWVDHRPLILMADDSPEIHALMRGYLKSGFCRLLSVFGGPEALHEFSTRNVSLVFLDLELGTSDGLAVARQMKAMPDRGTVPIVAMTGSGGRSVRERCLAAGCSEHLEKPVRRSVFLECIRKYIGDSALQPPAAPIGQEASLEPAKADRAPDLVLVDAELADLIPGYLAEALIQAVEAERLLALGDLPGVKRIAHQLKGSGGGYGFDQLSALAAPVEIAAKESRDSDAAAGLAKLRHYLENVPWSVAGRF